MRTETQLRDAVRLLAEPAPDTDQVLARLQLPAPAPERQSRRRPVLVAVGVGLALVLIGVLVWPRPTRDAAPDPAARRVVGNYSMISQILPPQGWSSGGLEVAGTYETSSVGDPTGKAWCRVEVDGAGVTPQEPVPASDGAAVVHGQPALYDATPGRGIGLYWHYGTDAWASIRCSTFLGRLGTAGTPAEVRNRIIGLAESVTFGDYPVRVPVGITRLPSGYRVGRIQVASGGVAATSWAIAFEPERVGTSTPHVQLGPSISSLPEVNARVGPYPAVFYTEALRGGVTTRPQPLVAYTELCVPGAPVAVCLSSAETGDTVPSGRRELFQEVAEQLTYAPSATDTSTWFDANEALPS